MPSRSTSQSLNALPSGTVLHDYIIESELGSGGFSMVYLARHRLNADWLFAIKEYLPRDLAVRDNDGASVHPVNTEAEDAFEDGRRRFRDEAEQLRRFRNERHVVSCLNYFEANGTAYLVMDYDDGLPLSEFLRQREEAGQPFTEADLRAVVEPLLEGLEVVHRAGVLHRDIKPGNVFVRRPDDIAGRPAQPVLIDFGAAKQNYLERHSRSRAPYTPGYAAYEQISSEGDIGPWTDIYAIGALMWRMVAGGCPDDPRLLITDEAGGERIWSPTPRAAEQRAYALHRGRPDPMAPAAELGAGRFLKHLLESIDKCLALYPEDRVRSCEGLQTLLKASATTQDTERKEAPQPTDDSRKKTDQGVGSAFGAGLIRAIAVMGIHLTVAGLALREAATRSGATVSTEQWGFLVGESLILGSITFTVATAVHWTLGRIAYFRKRRSWITWLVAAGSIAGWSNGAEDDVQYAAVLAALTAVFGAIIWTAIFLFIGLLWRGLKRLFAVDTGTQGAVAEWPDVDDEARARKGQQDKNTDTWVKAVVVVGAIAITLILVAMWQRPPVVSNSSVLPPTPRAPAFTILTDPMQAQVVFIDHNERYEPGMPLEEGNYGVEVSAPGYEVARVWLDHAEGISEHQVSLDPIRQAFTVDVEPPEARVRILNIEPVYEPGMLLPAGSYRVEVSAPGHETIIDTVQHDIALPTVLRVELSVEPSLSLAWVPDDGMANGTLEPGDSELPSGAYADFWIVQAESGQVLTADLISTGFDSFLTLSSPTDAEIVAEDDDSGEGTNARITFDIADSGEYLLVASSYEAGETGDYELRIDVSAPTPARQPALQQEVATSRPTTFTRGSHEDDVLRVQGTPTSIEVYSGLGHETWSYGYSTVEISISSRRVTEWSNAAGNLQVRLQPGSNVTNSTSFTRGSHEDDVLRLQGTPTSIEVYSGLGHETWSYGYSTVEISISSRRVTEWSNAAGNLQVRLQPGSNVTNSTSFTRGSHEDDVLRLQGTPTSIEVYSGLGHETWSYGYSTVEISISSRRVTEWSNTAGNLRVR